MAKRKCIGIVYSYDDNWIGGSYYIQNLLYALKGLPDEQRPFLKIICKNRGDYDSIRQISYPHCQIFSVRFWLPLRILNWLTAALFGKGWVDLFYFRNLDAIFPASLLVNSPRLQERIRKIARLKLIHWIPDFQEKYYPEFFTQSSLDRRDLVNRGIAESNDSLILSSRSALNDFSKSYPSFTCKVHVLNFSVTHPLLNTGTFPVVRSRYNLPDIYFFVPNQFWKHKNHIVVLRALKVLKGKGKSINVVFSGKESDYRNPEYFPGLKDYVRKEGLEMQTWFLGFIPRVDQLIIMKNSAAVVQPSLFEGWSTVVEDAKALNVFLIVSDIETHREQVKANAFFFHPSDENELAERILAVQGGIRLEPNNYEKNVLDFGRAFLRVVG